LASGKDHDYFMSVKEAKAIDSKKDKVTTVLATTLVGSFLIGSLVWWPGAAVTLIFGMFALMQALRAG
jgi:hypothetical protein